MWIGLAILTIAVFAPVAGHGFIDLDDPGYVAENAHVAAGITASGVVWAFTTGHAANWHPLTWLSHMADVAMFGMTPGAHHLVNVALHLANSLLLLWVFWRLTSAPWASALVAAIFALHPLHVESVAWIAERKDVLSTLFWMLTMWAYIAYARRPAWPRMALVVFCFALGLLAKPMLVTLPFVLLLIDYWPLSRTPTWQLVIEKLPLFACALVSSIVTFVVQRQGGAVSTLDVVPIDVRLGNALIAYVTYLRKMVWPVDLAPFYTYPRHLDAAAVVGAALLLTTFTALALRSARRRPYLLVGWLWYLGTLVPVIGLVQVGTQAMADRYTYVPMIGIAIAVVWAAREWWPRYRTALATAAFTAVALMAIATSFQVRHWQDSVTLWRHTVAVAPDNYRARNSLGAALGNQGLTSEAIVQFTEALRLDPDVSQSFHIHHNLGRALSDLGKVDEAIGHFKEALRQQPNYPEAHNNLGLALSRQGQHTAAIAEFRLALEDRPGFAPAVANLARAHNDFGFSLLARGLTTDAIREYSEALRVQPDFALAFDNRGFALAASGQMPEAIRDFREAVRLDPRLPSARHHLGIALAAVGEWAEAQQQLTTALELDPNNEGARRALAKVAGRGKQGRP